VSRHTLLADIMGLEDVLGDMVGPCRLIPVVSYRADHACFQRLKQQHDEPLSNFAFNFDMRLFGMDFKIAGTRSGITGIQLDCKPAGIPLDILVEALDAASTARQVGPARCCSPPHPAQPTTHPMHAESSCV
jgi:hypothetical protein